MQWFLSAKLKEKSFFYKLMLGLIATAVIPTIITIITLYHNYSESMLNEVSGANKKLLEQADSNSNMMLQEMTYAVSHLLSDMNLIAFMQNEYTSNAKAFNNLIGKVAGIVVNSRHISEIYVYFDQYGYFISADETSSGFRRIEEEPPLWYGYFTQNKTWGNQVHLIKQGADSSLYLIRPVLNSSYETVGAIVIAVGDSKFRQIFDHMLTNEQETVLVTNQAEEIMLCEGAKCGAQEPLITYSRQRSDGDYRIIEHNGEQLVMSMVESGMNGWKMMSFTPKKHLLEKINVFNHLTLLIMLLIITAMVIFSLFYSRYLYSPLRDLLVWVLKNQMEDREPTDEFRRIERAYRKIMLSRDHLERFVENNKSLMRDKLLGNIMMGYELEVGPIYEKFNFLGIRLPYRHFNVLLIEVYGSGPSEQSTFQNTVSWKMAIISLAEDLIERLGLTGLAFEWDSNSAALVVNHEIPDDSAMKLLTCELQAALNEFLGCPVRIGAGCWVEGLTNLFRSYQFSRKALAYFPHAALPEHDELAVDVLFYEKKISHGLALKNEAVLHGLIDEIMDMMHRSGRASWPHVYNIWLQLLSATMKKLEELHIYVYQKMMREQLFLKLADFVSEEDLREWLKTLYSQILERLLDLEEKSRNHHKIEMAEKLIREQYDQDLSLEYVAECVGLNATYLSKLFKDTMNVNFSEFLNRSRIERSKQILTEQPALSLDEIARRIGYQNTQSFTRYFKKFEGCTPGQYRQIAAGTP